MNIISKDFRHGIVQIKVTDKDDLWYLTHLIEPGDFVKGKTTRKIRIGEGDNAKVSKKTLTLQIEAEKIEFGEDGSSVRVNGTVNEETEDVPKDSYHTITLEEGSIFTLQKIQWLTYHKQKLEEAQAVKYAYLICLLDREEALFALTKHYGYTILTKVQGDVPKKGKDSAVKTDFHQELIKALEVCNDRHQPERIILASPAFYKDELFKKIKTDELRRKIVTAVCSDVHENSLDEVLRRPELKEALHNSRAREEQLLIDELLREIEKENLAVYGEEHVAKAIAAGAVRALLITDNFMAKAKEKNTYRALDEKMKHVDTLNGTIHIISSHHEGGKKLDGLGGIAALLRYNLSW